MEVRANSYAITLAMLAKYSLFYLNNKASWELSFVYLIGQEYGTLLPKLKRD